jgi:hypothetical protein
MKYGIIGSGSADTNLIQEGLLDILEDTPDAKFVIHARRNPQGSVETIYDFLADNEVAFYAVHRIDDNAPKALLNMAIDVVKDDNPTEVIINMSDKVLILWDESNEESSEKMAIMCADAGKETFDLTMALSPIVVQGSSPVVKEEPVEIPKEVLAEAPVKNELSPFSRDELMNMSIGVLRRQAKALGIENLGKTKESIVDAVFYHEEYSGDPIIASEVTQTPQEATEELALVVYWENGNYRTESVLLRDVKPLFN